MAKWTVLAGDNAGSLKKVATAKPTGFETAIDAPGTYDVYAVSVSNAHGTVTGSSAAVPITP